MSYTYPEAGAGTAPALEGISLRVNEGERLGILGPNGGGKSTLVKLLLGLLEPTKGTVRVFGLSPKEARGKGLIGYVPQTTKLEALMPLSVFDAVALGAGWRESAWRGLSKQVRDRVRDALKLVGAEEYATRPVGRLSGGQTQRVIIARALAAQPRLLAFDEPMVGIDAAGQQTFADLLTRIHKQRGLTMLVVSHDLRAIVAGSDRVACLARRMHSHTSPAGLTPQVLAELFSHEVAGLSGVLAGMHVHAHGAGEECTETAHTHAPFGVTIEGRGAHQSKEAPRADR